jgi:hypothetical protein
MGAIYDVTGKAVYKTVQTYLPTSPASSLPVQYALPRLPQSLSTLSTSLRFFNASTPVATISLSIEILLAYIVVAVTIAVAYFSYADVSRKLS